MKHEVKFDYGLLYRGETDSNDNVYGTAVCKLTDNDLREIRKAVREGKVKKYINELPEKIVKKFECAISEAVWGGGEFDDYGSVRDEYEEVYNVNLPEDLLKILPKDCQEILNYTPSEEAADNSSTQSEDAQGQPQAEEEITYIGDDGQPDVPEWEVSEEGEELYLVMKQEYFDKIVEGTKQIEYREIKDSTYKRYIEVDKKGNPCIDEEALQGLESTDMAYLMYINRCPYIPKDYRYLSLGVGYNKDRDTAKVEVGGIGFEFGYGQKGNPCWIIKYFIKKVLEVNRGKK